MIEPWINASFLILDKKEYKYGFEGDELRCASRARNLPSSQYRSIVVRALFFCFFYLFKNSRKKILTALYNHGFVVPFAIVVPCLVFCLWNKATEALKQVRFILPCSAYDKLFWHIGTATGQGCRITAARRIFYILKSVFSSKQACSSLWKQNPAA